MNANGEMYVKKVSVILPVYNTKVELPKCLESLMNQTYQEIEVICVDDGSTDGSEKIVDEFASAHKQIKVIHKPNAGESSARNIGLKLAEGEYIAFCDCDDWVEPDMYKTLVHELEDWNVDMVASAWFKDNSTDCQEIKNRLYVTKEVFGRAELLKYIYMRDSYRGFAYLWNKLFKRSTLENKQGKILLFDETLQLGGDVLYLAEAALKVKRAKYVEAAFYHYTQRESSGSHTKDTKKLMDSLKAYEAVINRFEEENIESETIRYVKRFLAYHGSNAMEIAVSRGQETDKEKFRKIMKKYEKEYIDLNRDYPERIQRYQNLLEQ